MYLRSDERQRGVDNFFGVMAAKPMRQSFLQDAMTKKLTPSSGLNGYYFHYEKPTKPLAVGVLGVGRQGVKLITAMRPDVYSVKSIADIRPSSQTAALAALPGHGGKWKTADEAKGDIKTYASYEKLIEAAKADGIQAVVIALPSHLHAPAALAAMKAKLHVLVETPMALTVADAKAMVKAAKAENVCLAVAQQRRYSLVYDNALAMVRANLLEDVHYLRSQWHVPIVDHKDEKAKGSKKPAKKSGDTAIDWWGSVPEDDATVDTRTNGYKSVQELVNWQLVQKLGGGMIAELGTQLFDAAAMIMAEIPNRDPARKYPLSVAGSSSQVLSSMGDIDDHVHCIFEYAAKGYVDNGPQKTRRKIGLQFDMIVGNEFDAYGELLLGKKGTLAVESERRGVFFHRDDIDKRVNVIPAKDKTPVTIDVPKDGSRGSDEGAEALARLALTGIDTGTAGVLEHFAVCCANPEKNKPRCDGETGLFATVLAVAATKAVETGARFEFQDAWFDAEKTDSPDDLKAG